MPEFYGDEQRALQDRFDSRVAGRHARGRHRPADRSTTRPRPSSSPAPSSSSARSTTTVTRRCRTRAARRASCGCSTRRRSCSRATTATACSCRWATSPATVASACCSSTSRRPHRVRVHANATVSADDPLLAEYPGADLIVRATVTDSFDQLPPLHHPPGAGAEPSKYVPDDERRRPARPAGRRSTSCRTSCPSASRAGPRPRAAPSPSTSTTRWSPTGTPDCRGRHPAAAGLGRSGDGGFGRGGDRGRRAPGPASGGGGRRPSPGRGARRTGGRARCVDAATSRSMSACSWVAIRSGLNVSMFLVRP